MTTQKTPGKRLVETLNRSLKPGTEWDERELATLDLLMLATDRLAALQKVCDKAIADPSRHRPRLPPWPRRCAVWSSAPIS